MTTHDPTTILHFSESSQPASPRRGRRASIRVAGSLEPRRGQALAAIGTEHRGDWTGPAIDSRDRAMHRDGRSVRLIGVVAAIGTEHRGARTGRAIDCRDQGMHRDGRAVRLIGVVAAIACALVPAPVRADEDERSSAPSALPVVVHGPAVAEVLTAAYRAAGLDRDPSRGWNARARVAGLVPWITVRTGRDTSWKNTDTDVGHGMVVEVRATWRLDRLVFDGRELQVASVEAARRRERRRLASRVIRAYFAWRRALERTTERPDCDPADPAGDPAGRGCASRAALVDEAAAELDALTDGWFSDALADPPTLSRGFSGRPSRRTASENRTR